jgi:hypothetical protein
MSLCLGILGIRLLWVSTACYAVPCSVPNCVNRVCLFYGLSCDNLYTFAVGRLAYLMVLIWYVRLTGPGREDAKVLSRIKL